MKEWLQNKIATLHVTQLKLRCRWVTRKNILSIYLFSLQTYMCSWLSPASTCAQLTISALFCCYPMCIMQQQCYAFSCVSLCTYIYMNVISTKITCLFSECTILLDVLQTNNSCFSIRVTGPFGFKILLWYNYSHVCCKVVTSSGFQRLFWNIFGKKKSRL